MGASSFNAMELDAIGEIMNISLGASATAISTLLGTKVNITTPVAQVLSSDEFSFKRMEPAVGVDIAYVKGLSGSNVMIFRRNDVRVIVGIMMGMEIPEEEFELDEMNISAVCEVMNQMMGSSATALSEFLGYTVDISTPKSFEITDDISFKERYFPSGTEQVLVRFNLEIGDSLKSEFMNIMTIDLIKRLLAPFAESLGLDEADVTPGPVVEPEDSIIRADGAVSQEEVQVATVSEPAAAPSGDAMMSQEEIQALMAGNAPEPAAAPSGDAMMSQEEIQAKNGVAGASAGSCTGSHAGSAGLSGSGVPAAGGYGSDDDAADEPDAAVPDADDGNDEPDETGACKRAAAGSGGSEAEYGDPSGQFPQVCRGSRAGRRGTGQPGAVDEGSVGDLG